MGKHSCPWSVDLLSIDVDGVDYWLWRDFLESGRAAKVVVIEFNPSMPDDLHYVPPRADAQRHGASLAALCALGEAYDYCLVETTLFNAVFADAATRAILVERVATFSTRPMVIIWIRNQINFRLFIFFIVVDDFDIHWVSGWIDFRSVK